LTRNARSRKRHGLTRSVAGAKEPLHSPPPQDAREDAECHRDQDARAFPDHEEGTLAKWLIKAGDTVKSGDLMAEIETDKATMEFEAVDEGTITEIVVPKAPTM